VIYVEPPLGDETTNAAYLTREHLFCTINEGEEGKEGCILGKVASDQELAPA
jgi:hypothetical protein